MTDTYKGFELFSDIEDKNLRNRNRAVVLTNMASMHTKNKRINAAGAGLILGYFNLVPMEDKADVQYRFMEQMQKEGFSLVAN